MGVKISDLTSATSLTGSEELPIVQSGNTKKATVEQLQIQNLIYAVNDSAFKLSATHTYQDIPVVSSTTLGNKLTISGGVVTIGAGVSSVKVYAFTGWSNIQASENKYMQIAKSGSSFFLARKYMTSSNTEEIQFQVIMDVTEGDTIKLQIYGTTNDEVPTNRAILLVEVLTYGTTGTRSTEQLRSTGELVGLGDRAEVGEIETKADEPLEENTEVKESGENDELR